MPSKIVSSVPDRRHPGLSKITLESGTQLYKVRVGTYERRFSISDYKLALADLAIAMAARAKGVKTSGGGSKTPVAEVIDAYEGANRLAVTEGRMALGTAGNYANSLKYLAKVHGNVPIGKLSAKHLQEVIVAGRTTGIQRADGKPGRVWAAETHRLFTIAVKLFLDYAVAQRLAPVNVARLEIKAPKQSAATRYESDHWTTEEMADLQDRIDADAGEMAVAFHLALAGGLRRGEIAGLRWMDLDWVNGMMNLSNTRVDNDGKIQEKGTKSGKDRKVPLKDPILIAALRAQQQRLRLVQRTLSPTEAYVVTNAYGEPFAPDHITKGWKKFLKVQELRYINTHGSRHSWFTLWANTPEVPLHITQAAGGHASIATTGIYLHSDDAGLTAAAKAAAAVLRAARAAGSTAGST